MVTWLGCSNDRQVGGRHHHHNGKAWHDKRRPEIRPIALAMAGVILASYKYDSVCLMLQLINVQPAHDCRKFVRIP